jgi:hypothetical protein
MSSSRRATPISADGVRFSSQDSAVPTRLYELRFSLSLKGENGGIIFSDGSKWSEQRRFSLHVLRDFGFGRNLMQTKIMEEVNININKLSAEIDKAGSAVVRDLNVIFDLLVGSIINKIVIGYRFDEVRRVLDEEADELVAGQQEGVLRIKAPTRSFREQHERTRPSDVHRTYG